MEVTVDNAKALFKDLGFDAATVDNWKREKLTERINLFPGVLRGRKAKDKRMRSLLASVVEARDSGQHVEVVTVAKKASKPPSKAPPPAKKGVKGKARQVEDDEDDFEDDELDEEDEDVEEEEDFDGDDEEEESEDEEEDLESDDDSEADEEDDGEFDSDDDQDDDDEEADESDDDDDESKEEDDDLIEDDEEEEEEDDETPDDEEEEEEVVATKKPKGKKGAKPAPAKGGKGKPGGAFRSAAGNGQPGVIGSIVEFLSAANEANPISKKTILAKLKKRFPDRGDEMMTTINIHVPTRLRAQKNLNVKKNEKGYWISTAGKKKPK